MLNLLAAMQSRVSTRTFNGEPLSDKDLKALESFLQEPGLIEMPDFLLPVRITLHTGRGAKMGTMGLIASAAGFLVPAVQKAPFAMESVGYCLERAILQATSLGIGSCWIGGVFSRARANEVAKVVGAEIVPVIAALGYPANQRSLADRIVTGAAQSRVRKPMSEIFFSSRTIVYGGAALNGNGVPADTPASPWDTILEMVRIAPSASNKQPWRIMQVSEASRFIFFMEENYRYNNSLGDVHLQNIDMGIAMCHFDTAAEAFGVAGTWQPLEDANDSRLTGDAESISDALAFGNARGWKPIAIWEQKP